MTTRFNQLWNKLTKSKKYRSAFARAQFKRLVPFQIRALRKQRGWSQELLAINANMTQGVISRAEDSDYGNLTVNTILSIAEGFDVVFVGKFVPYSEFVCWYENLSETLPPIPSFEEEEAQIAKNLGESAKDEQISKAIAPRQNVIPMERIWKTMLERGQGESTLPQRAPRGDTAYAALGGNAR